MSEGTTIAIVKDNEVYVTEQNGKTAGIVRDTMLADKIGRNEVKDFAQQFSAANIVQICYNIWQWVVSNIPYVEDKDGEQCVQTPGQLYKNRATQFGGTGAGGDCKSMSVFCSAILSALGITDYKFRFAGEYANEDLHHVYLIVRNGNSYVTLDCTPILDGQPAFNAEIDYVKKVDVEPGNTSPRIGASKSKRPKVGATQQQAVGDKWAVFERDYRNNITNAVNAVKAQIEGAIKIKYYYKPVKYGFAIKLVDDANFQPLLTAASMMIYKYWDDSNIYQANLQGVNIPFPSALLEKRKAGNEFYDDLIEYGLRPGDIFALVSLSVFKNYGISLEYMLYRCKNMALYGQEFGVTPGVPYYNSKTGAVVANGASLEDAIKIGMVYPVDGGTGKPYGEPYWCYGGYIMANGASPEVLAAFTNNTEKPVSKFVNNGDGVSKEFFSVCLLKYNEWKAGNLVVLPAPTWSIYDKYKGNNKPKIGLAAVAIAPIVVAVVTAVVTIVTAIAKIIQNIKSKNLDENRVADPPKDNGFQYPTADGCFIGYNVNGDNGSHYVKSCNGQIVDYNPDLSAPENQPGAGNFLPSTIFTPKNLLIGAGVTVGAIGLYKLSQSSNQ